MFAFIHDFNGEHPKKYELKANREVRQRRPLMSQEVRFAVSLLALIISGTPPPTPAVSPPRASSVGIIGQQLGDSRPTHVRRTCPALSEQCSPDTVQLWRWHQMSGIRVARSRAKTPAAWGGIRNE
ncbi:unnamed protein product [Schistocephalus solidus]|uniref:Uncharacterized protein n=1 Tax=Schistocephalus solidus TaxID=70667 RepID=A0A183T3Z7_SCHSO|nr:unnamed protein product [Schistocephalus solidus]